MGFVLVGILLVLAMIGLARPYVGLLALLIVMELDPGELYPQLAPLHLERVVALLLIISFVIHGEKLRFPIAYTMDAGFLLRNARFYSIGILARQRICLLLFLPGSCCLCTSGNCAFDERAAH